MKQIHVSGKRKMAIARATLMPGNGNVRINKLNLNYYEPKLARTKIMEPLLLTKEVSDKVDINISVMGGGVMSQAEAVRLAIGRALVKHKANLKERLLEYDRHLLVADVRRREVSKPNSKGKARSKRQKSYR